MYRLLRGSDEQISPERRRPERGLAQSRSLRNIQRTGTGTVALLSGWRSAAGIRLQTGEAVKDPRHGGQTGQGIQRGLPPPTLLGAIKRYLCGAGSGFCLPFIMNIKRS